MAEQYPQHQQSAAAPQSPPKHSPSPAPQAGYSIPPVKRPRTEQSPPPATSYAALQYAASPPAASPSSPASNYDKCLPPTTNPTLQAAPQPRSQQYYQKAYSNGKNAAVTLHLPNARLNSPQSPSPLAVQTPSPAFPPSSVQNQTIYAHPHHYTSATMAPITASTPGIMGPPSKPAEKPTKEYEYDVSDTLAGTGIDIRQEEQALLDYFAPTAAPEARHGFGSNPPGPRSSFYGAGWANQPAQPTAFDNQDQYIAERAEIAWREAALRMAHLRKNEMDNPFLSLGNLHHKAQSLAHDYGLRLNTSSKTAPANIPKTQAPPKVNVSSTWTPEGSLVTTSGSFSLHESYLSDMLALLSLATKHHLREKIEDADGLAKARQLTAHGAIPPDWADVAAPLPDQPSDAGPANSSKRSFDAAMGRSASSTQLEKASLARVVREHSKEDREAEEARLRKRQKRLNLELGQNALYRASSSAFGAVGGSAGGADGEKPPSKKELKKSLAAARLAETSSTVSANQTLGTLMNKGKKKYSWMTAGSGASGPRAYHGPHSGSPAAASTSRALEKANLTQEGRYRLGAWRENGDKGKNIQLRDWLTVLEMDGLDIKAIQEVYVKLDESLPK